MESKLPSFGCVQGLMFDNYGEVSEATHKLLDISRVRVALPQSAAVRGEGTAGQRRKRKLWQ